jgi:hypothetical protein
MSGWGEVTAGENPFYNEEWTDSVWPLVDELQFAAHTALSASLT